MGGCLHDVVIRRGKVFFCQGCGQKVKVRAKGSKYHNEKITIDNIMFDSRREGRRYQDLKLMKHAAFIRELDLQPPFEFRIDGVLMFTYYADFQYIDVEKNCRVIEDCKGDRTDVYRLKKKIIEAHHKIRIIET